MASSWLDRVVADNLGSALVWRNSKRHVKIEPGTEPKQHALYTDDGSSLKVRVTMPSAVLQVLKVQGQTLTLTDGVVSIQAKVANTTMQRFENQHSFPISSIKNKSIIVSSCDITATHLGPPASHVQLMVLGLTISSASLDLSDVSAVTPIHRFSAVRDFLQRLYQLPNPPTERAAPTPAFVPAEESADVEMPEAPSSATKSAEKVNPMKRPHSSPSRSSSHRLIRPRIHEGYDDVVIQKGVNLQQPVHASTNSYHQSDLLRNLLSRNRLPSAGSASSSTAIEQALRLGTGMTAQMGPPPVPTARTDDDQAQTRLHSLSQSQSQLLSQNFQSQIPVPEPATLESVVADTESQVVLGSQPRREDPDLNIPKVGLPNNTPTSAQPEPTEVLQSSLPRGNLPPPSQPAQTPSTSMDTSSSHLLDDPSSGVQRSMHRAPPPMLIKYASRPIPENQKRLLAKPTSWWPARPGTTFPHPNLPLEVIQEMEEYAEQRAARKKTKRDKEMEEERERARERERERERTRERLADIPPTQNTQSSALPWSSSPPAPGPSRHRRQTHRRSTNSEVPLPPDSSAEDPMEVDEPEEEIPSSPPSGSLSDDNDASDIDESLNIIPKPNLRQLPEYPLSSPEEGVSRRNPRLHPGGSQPTRNVQENSGVQSQEQAIEKHSAVVDEDVPSSEMRANPSVPSDRQMNSALIDAEDDTIVIDQPQIGNDDVVKHSPQVEVDKVMEDRPQVEDGNIMDDQPQVNVGRITEDEPQVEVAASPQSQSELQPPRRRRRWGLEGSAETTEERQARNRREFMERFRQNLQTSDAQETTPVLHTNSRANSEVQKEPEMPTSERQPVVDQMEVDRPLIDPTRSVDPTVAKRISIIEQWRRQSHQQEGHTEAGAPDAVLSRPIVSEPTTVEPILSEPVASVVNESFGSGPIIPVSAGHGVAVSESAASESVVSGVNDVGLRERNTPHSEILASVRVQPSHQPAESNLPPSVQDDQMSNAEPQSRAEKQRPALSVRANKAPTYKSKQEASSDVRLKNLKDIERRNFGKPTRALWVGSLPADINDEQVSEMFADFNPVLVAAKNQCAFVNFADIETACKALEFLHNKKIVCNFTAPCEYSDNYVASSAVSRDPLLPSRPPAPDLRSSSEIKQSRQNDTLLLSLTIEDLFREFSKKRKFKGNRKAFENLCRKLYGAPTLIPLAQWDNYVVLQPAQYVPYVNRSVSNGEVFDDYDTYWNEHLRETPPHLIPILTPAKLEAAFKNGPGSQSPASKSGPQPPAIRSGNESPASKSSAPVSPQTISGATHLRPSSAQRTPFAAPTSTPRKAPVPEDLRRSVVERNAQNMISRPQSAAPEAANLIMDIPEPRRASVWLKNTVSAKPEFKVVQSDLYGMYKETFKAGKLQLLNGKLFSDLVLSTFPVLKTTKDTDDKGGFTFYFDGLCFKQSSHPTPTRVPTPSDANTPGFRIKGASASSPGETPNRSQYLTPSGDSTRQERDERSRRSLPFAGEQQRSRPPPPSSTPRNPSFKGTPKGKPSPSDHLPTREDLGEYFDTLEYQRAMKNYQSLGKVTKKGNAFSERE